jgi:hypothetical protein
MTNTTITTTARRRTTTNKFVVRTSSSSLVILWVVVSLILCWACFLWGSSQHHESRTPSDIVHYPALPEGHSRRKDNILQEQQAVAIYDDVSLVSLAWKIHPPLLSHPNPHHVVAMMSFTLINAPSSEQQQKQVEQYIQLVTQHRLVRHLTLIQIVHVDDSTNLQEKDQQESIFIQSGVHVVRRTFFMMQTTTNKNRNDSSVDSWLRHVAEMDNASPINLVIMDEMISQYVTSSEKYLSSLLGVFNRSNEDDAEDDNDDDDNEDDNAHLTLVLELLGSPTSTARQRHYIANILESSWEIMTDYTVRAVTAPYSSTSTTRSTHYHQFHNYVILFNDFDTQAYRHFNEAEWNRILRMRLAMDNETTHGMTNEIDKKHGLDCVMQMVLDSTLMLPIEYPSKHSEITFCQELASDWPDDCGLGQGTGINPSKQNIPTFQLVVKQSQQGDFSGRGLYTKVDIPPNSWIGAEQEMVYLEWPSSKLLGDLRGRHVGHDDDHEDNDEPTTTNTLFERLVNILYPYFDGYGVVHVWQVR